MRLTTDNPDGEVYYSSEIPDILITNAHDPVRITIRKGSTVLIEDEYQGREIRIRHLTASLSPYMRPGSNPLGFEINDARGLYLDGSFSVIKCTVGVEDPNNIYQYLDRKFLSTLQGIKRTTQNRTEFVSWCGPSVTGNQTVQFAGLYRDASGTEQTIRTEIIKNVPAQLAFTLDVSPNNYKRDGLQLCEYTISVGNRSQTFVVLPPQEFEKEFLFTNPFGVKESIAFIGGETKEGKREREYATVEGEYIPIYHRTVTEYTAFSGVVRKYEADWIQSFIESHEIIHKHTGRRIAILEDKLQRSSKLNELPQLELKYRYSDTSPVMYYDPKTQVFTNQYTREYE